MKTPLTYYGGKQKIAKWIISHFPKDINDRSYIEPFAGGLAVFFAKEPVQTEVVNDLNFMIYNFWKQLRNNPVELHSVLDSTLYNKRDFQECRDIFNRKRSASDLEKARATFVTFNCSFGTAGHSWARNKIGMEGGTLMTKIFREKISMIENLNRLKNTYIENQNALNLIRQWDNEKAFFYCDPPYPGADQGSYSGYTMQDFNALLQVLRCIAGKFQLSCYLLPEMNIPSNWRIEKKENNQVSAMVGNGGKKAGRY